MALRQRYNNVLRRLYNVNKTFTVTMRLDNIVALHELVGRPLDAFHTIHVAGTNGKGSVCWKTAAALRHAGHRVGLFTSPHIASFRERARVDGRLASEAAVVDILEELFAVTEREGLPHTSFFEYTTLFGLLHFARAGVDYAVLEAGCGGRLDGTNLVARPLLTCITSLGLDHPAILGDTLEQVAYHKAGIMKPGVPCFAGRGAPGHLLRPYADAMGAEHCPVPDASGPPPAGGRDFDRDNGDLVRHMLHTSHARGLVHAPADAVEWGAAQRPPYRLEEVDVSPLFADGGGGGDDDTAADDDSAGAGNCTDGGKDIRRHPLVVLDCAHNTDAFDALFTSLRAAHFRHRGGCDDVTGSGVNAGEGAGRSGEPAPLRLRVVLGFSGEKDVRACLQRVLRHVPASRVHFVTSDHGRAVPGHVLVKALVEEAAALAESHDVVGDGDETLRTLGVHDRAAFRRLLERAGASGDDAVVVCGSMYALGSIRRTLGGPIVYDDVQKV